MRLPRIMIAGTSSGSGKTTAVCAVLSLLGRTGAGVKACKCGPDYIDPMFHRSVSGVPCANLDPFFCDGNMLRYLLSRNAGERVTVIEGVMGYYDGTGQDGTDNSTYTVARETRTPVVLVIDARGAAASLLAVMEGFLDFVPDSGIKGVIFSRMSGMNYRNVERLIRQRFGDRIRPLGYIPVLPEECLIPSRHLGLVTADEIEDLSLRIGRTADMCADTLDMDGLLELADSAPEAEFTVPEIKKYPEVKIAVARDEAFCFYYSDTLRLLSEMGAELCFFSPLADETVPSDADGLLLGGGYPELHAEELEKAVHSRESVRDAVLSGMPVIAECGGFQYLGKELEGRVMCGALPHTSANTGRLVRFGYVTLKAEKDGLLGPAGTELPAHEFHYWDSSENGDAFTAVKPGGRQWKCAVETDTMYAGYPHLFLPACPEAAARFYEKCLEHKEKRI